MLIHHIHHGATGCYCQLSKEFAGWCAARRATRPACWPVRQRTAAPRCAHMVHGRSGSTCVVAGTAAGAGHISGPVHLRLQRRRPLHACRWPPQPGATHHGHLDMENCKATCSSGQQPVRGICFPRVHTLRSLKAIAAALQACATCATLPLRAPSQRCRTLQTSMCSCRSHT